jgi:VanZ family protein
VLGATAFSALIEVVQALVLGIGRACDTSDWITNTIGAVIGGGLATVALARRRHRGRLSSAQ